MRDEGPESPPLELTPRSSRLTRLLLVDDHDEPLPAMEVISVVEDPPEDSCAVLDEAEPVDVREPGRSPQLPAEDSPVEIEDQAVAEDEDAVEVESELASEVEDAAGEDVGEPVVRSTSPGRAPVASGRP